VEPESSLPCSEEPSTGPYPEPDQSNQYHSIELLGWEIATLQTPSESKWTIFLMRTSKTEDAANKNKVKKKEDKWKERWKEGKRQKCMMK
jgi:hypothetical protein